MGVSEKALRFNEGKPELSYVLSMPRALVALSWVFARGAVKYARGQWKAGGKPDEEYIDSAMRHLLALANGERFDPDLGTMHAAQVMWNMGALIQLTEGELVDPDFDYDAFVARWQR